MKVVNGLNDGRYVIMLKFHFISLAVIFFLFCDVLSWEGIRFADPCVEVIKFKAW